MRGLDPRIHQPGSKASHETMGCRVKPGNDEGEVPRFCAVMTALMRKQAGLLRSSAPRDDSLNDGVGSR
jgi:hypothetical protein